jgi:hypothetical protein
MSLDQGSTVAGAGLNLVPPPVTGDVHALQGWRR